MKTLCLSFGKSENITQPDYYAVYRFPFTVIDSELIGSPEETRMTTTHSVIVEVTATQRAGLAWGDISEPDFRKILFEIGRRKIMDKAKRDSLSATETVTVDASTHGAKRPFNPSDIVEPDGTIFYVEKEHRRIGF
jgi:hypothetical protein